METTGPRSDPWDGQRIEDLINEKKDNGFIFVLPIASIIETGNHVAHTHHTECADKLMILLESAVIGDNPWALFSEQHVLWESPNVDKLINDWPITTTTGISIGDYTIEMIAEYYLSCGFQVQLLTSDQGLQDRISISSRIPSPRRSRYK